MAPFPLPVRTIGTGSQAEETAPGCLGLTTEMATFCTPPPPQESDPHALAGVRRLLGELVAALRGRSVWRRELSDLDAATLALLDQTLGEGEVSAIVRAPRRLEIQETAFAGLWRVRERDADGVVVAESLEAGPIPSALPAAMTVLAGEVRVPTRVPGLMNAPAVLTEILAHAACHAAGGGEHVINLTLLPMSGSDLSWLEAALGEGPVRLLSRGYGTCRIDGTRLANVWRVRHFNSMDRLILDTLEVGTVPAAALATPEDVAASRARLEEWIALLEVA